MRNGKLPLELKMCLAVSTWFYVGFLPLAPGTAGSLASYPIYAICRMLVFEPQLLFFLAAALLFAIGLSAIRKLQASYQVQDHVSIVIDEVVGQLLTFAIAYDYLYEFSKLWVLPCSSETTAFFIGVLWFRIFDICKPFGIKAIDRRFKGAWGVLLDDVAAAVLAGLSFIIFSKIFTLIHG